MSEPILLPGQPYEGLPGWEDLSGYLTNGWQIGNQNDYLLGFLEPNSAKISGRLRVGTDRVATLPLPTAYRPLGSTRTGPSASLRGIGPAEVEVWGGAHVVLPHNSVAPGSRAEHYTGEIFIFEITYPRRKL